MTNELPPDDKGYRKLFIVGCPRSGTTWVQLLLASFDQIATAPETQIFAYYLTHFEQQWANEQQNPDGLHGTAGLSRVLSQAEFDQLCRQSALAVLEKIRRSRPQATVVAEKSPKHALHTTFIRKLFPDAYLLHVIRDPRDVAVSLRAAGESWGSSWAPRSVVSAARLWAEHIEQARRASEPAAQYREVRYEELKQNTAHELQAILSWIGIEADAATCQAAADACELKELQKIKTGDLRPLPGSKSPEGFFRKGEVGGWRSSLSRSEVRAIEYVAGDLMGEFGYDRVLPKRSIPARVLLHDGLSRVRESVDWQLARVLQRI